MDAARQAYVQRQLGIFFHFSMGTYTGQEWADGSIDPSTFQPNRLDTDQWIDAAVSSGAQYAVLTAKHHDGFALWPTSQSRHSVANAPWGIAQPSGQADIVRRFADSCRRRGLAVGLYYSIWDKTNGIDANVDPIRATAYVKAELTELLTQYGPIVVLWTDGWKWRTGYKSVDWAQVRAHMRAVSPDTLLLENNHEKDDVHTDIVAYERNVDGLPERRNQYPSELSDTIRADNLWFYHPGKGGEPKPTAYFLDSLHTAHSAGAAYLLDVTPDRDGRLPDDQVATLKEIGQYRSSHRVVVNRRQGADGHKQPSVNKVEVSVAQSIVNRK